MTGESVEASQEESETSLDDVDSEIEVEGGYLGVNHGTLKKEVLVEAEITKDGMTCSACSSGLEKYLNKQDGIKQANVNLVMNNANIEYDEQKLTIEQVEKFIEKAGFTSLGIDTFEKESKKSSYYRYRNNQSLGPQCRGVFHKSK